MEARRLSFGESLFDLDTEEETGGIISASPPQRLPSKGHVLEQELTHQAQKRRAGTSGLDRNGATDEDATDEEDFVALNERALKRFHLSKSIVSLPTSDFHSQEQKQPPHPTKRQQDWSKVTKIPRKTLQSSLTTLSLVTASPTREYGLELERSCSPLTNCPIMERNRSWNNGSTVVDQSQPMTISNSSSILTNTKAPNPRATEAKDLNTDELECASVLAGLGWG